MADKQLNEEMGEIVDSQSKFKEAASAFDIPQAFVEDGLVVLAVLPDENGKMTDDQRDLLRDWLFDKLKDVPGAQDVIDLFKKGNINNEEAIRRICSCAEKIDPTHSIKATSTLMEVAQGSKKFNADLALQVVLESLPPRTRLIAKALMARGQFRKKKDRLMNTLKAAEDVSKQQSQPASVADVRNDPKGKSRRRRRSKTSIGGVNDNI